jgi:type VI secretion system protein VasG
MLRGLVATLEKHHGVRILDEAVKAAVKLSMRYIPARQLPDKGVSLLDTACARVAMSQRADLGPRSGHRKRRPDGRDRGGDREAELQACHSRK